MAWASSQGESTTLMTICKNNWKEMSKDQCHVVTLALEQCGKRSGVQGHLQLHSRLEDSWCYQRPYLRERVKYETAYAKEHWKCFKLMKQFLKCIDAGRYFPKQNRKTSNQERESHIQHLHTLEHERYRKASYKKNLCWCIKGIWKREV